MLSFLSIENIAIIEKCEIEFDKGFNVLTGETGAGKSIIIDSLNAVLGQRVSRDIIRSGCRSASVTAKFDFLSSEVAELLDENGISHDDGIIITRTMHSDGRNICKINSVITGLSVLRELGARLINIHGQYDNQLLLDAANHYKYLDSFAKNEKETADYKSTYEEYKATYRQLNKMLTDNAETSGMIENLKYKINEISAANVLSGEYDELIKKRKIMRNSEKIYEVLSQVMQLLNGDEDTSGAIGAVGQAYSLINGINNQLDESDFSDRLSCCNEELAALAGDMRKLYEKCNYDPAELESTEERISVLNELLRKYGPTERDILNNFEKYNSEMKRLDSGTENIEKTQKKLDLLQEKLKEKGQKLTESRKNAAEIFSKKVVDILKYLEMPDITFVVKIQQAKYTSNGCDNVEFLFSANKGQEPRALSKIASGGELSRVMLAFESILCDTAGADTLIFDEIDSGISGITAGKVGKQIKKVSLGKQVICVTHLAQIAAAADSHWLIEKYAENDKTYTHILRLDTEHRIKEISRIISGSEMTDNTYKTAKELIDSYR